MTIPENTKIHDFPSSTIWFDENGILCSIAKKVEPQSVAEAKETIEQFRQITGGKKVCMLSDSTNSVAVNKEMRDYIATVMPDLVLAIAVISRSAVGRMVANLFFSIKKQPYPVKIFTSEVDAKNWLKQYLQN